MKGIDLNKYTIDFLILDTNDPKSILLLDRSNYLFTPEKPRLFITPPGFTGDIDVEYPGISNTIIELTSDSLGITENCNYEQNAADLDDGVYQITMAVCPYEELYSKKCYLKTTKLECKLQELLLNYDDNCQCIKDKEFRDSILEIEFLILSAKAEVSICNVDKATDKYKQALKLLNHLDKKLKCK